MLATTARLTIHFTGTNYKIVNANSNETFFRAMVSNTTKGKCFSLAGAQYKFCRQNNFSFVKI